MKLLLILIFTFSAVFAENILYTKNQVHAFLPKNGTVNLFLGVQAMNDTIDILNVKEDEIDTTTAGFNTLGDMLGADIELSYSFWDNFFIYGSYGQKNIDYLGRTLENTNINTYLRYQAYKNNNFAIAFDGGYETNIAKDSTITSSSDINPILKRISPDTRLEIIGNTLFYGNSTASLSNTPYIELKETKDETFYGRGIISYKQNDLLMDLFAGYKQITVESFLDTSFANEPNIKTELEANNVNGSLSSNRDDAMFFVGFSLREKFFKRIFAEFSYQYTKMLRIDGLKYIDYNHTIDMTLTYPIKDNIAVYLGGKVMSRQLNGEIPYMYNQYTQTTFDHRYGWATTGLIIKF